MKVRIVHTDHQIHTFETSYRSAVYLCALLTRDEDINMIHILVTRADPNEADWWCVWYKHSDGRVKYSKTIPDLPDYAAGFRKALLDMACVIPVA